MLDRDHVVLLQAPVPGAQNRLVAKPSAIPPLGLGYLAAVLLQDGFAVDLVDMDVEDMGEGELAALLERVRPAVVGISATTLTVKNAIRVAKIVKRSSPDALVVLGGPHTTVRPLDALCYPWVDVVVRGEGERTFLELCRAVRAGGELPAPINGTTWRVNGGCRALPPRARILDLDTLPFPARHLMPLDRYNIPGTVLTSRGCPFACGFCAGPLVLGRRYTARSAECVVDEVQTLIDLFGLTSFYFVDDTMTASARRLLRLCDGMRRLRIPSRLTRRLKWTCEARADSATRATLAAMASAGCTTIQFGMESGSQALLDTLGKKVTLEQIENAVAWSRAAGISPVLSMVFPHPDETEVTFRQTLAFIQKLYDLGAEKIIPALLTPFPGTRFFEERERLGLMVLTADTDEYNLGTPVVTTPNFGLDKIANGYSLLLAMTQRLGGSEIGGIAVDSPGAGTGS